MADHRYRIIKRLEAGGMAEVYHGEASGPEGFRKQVAIKRVLPHLAKNENFIHMFLDEARLSARLSHANIVTVFDISARDDTYFLIMEFVDGANLKRILESLQRRSLTFSLPEAIYTCAEACRGLSYAHELHDENGRPLNIVHRDISPPNIMLTKRGEVKVADFGLAKAGTQLSQTDPGVVKGKFSYLSPEAANGLEVDARSDIFSLGIVLWEMLAGKRLFLGETDYATVKLIQTANIPRLSGLNSQVDETFEEIMHKALARDREDRYQSAQQFGDALTGYLFARQLKVTNYTIASLVKSAISEDAAPINRDVSLIDRLIQEEIDGSVALRPEHMPMPNLLHAAGQPHEGGLEDPANWFKDEPDTVPLSMPKLQQRPSTPAKTGWHESGVEYEPDLSDEDLVDANDSSLRPTPIAPAKQPGARPEPPARPAPPATPGSARSQPSLPPSASLSTQARTSRTSIPGILSAAAAGAKGNRGGKTAFGKYFVIGMALLAVLALAIVLLGKRL